MINGLRPSTSHDRIPHPDHICFLCYDGSATQLALVLRSCHREGLTAWNHWGTYLGWPYSYQRSYLVCVPVAISDMRISLLPRLGRLVVLAIKEYFYRNPVYLEPIELVPPEHTRHNLGYNSAVGLTFRRLGCRIYPPDIMARWHPNRPC
jgi:hypothetical protein